MGVVSAIAAVAGLGLSAYSASDTHRQAKKAKKDKKREIGRQQMLEADEKRKARRKIEERKMAVELEGNPSTFKSGMLGLISKAPTRKKRLGNG